MSDKIKVEWHDGGREPQCQPNPNYPRGIDVDASDGASKTCRVSVPYPARRCGYYTLRCTDCGLSVAVTTAGRPDDPRSVKLACKKGTRDGQADHLH